MATTSPSPSHQSNPDAGQTRQSSSRSNAFPLDCGYIQIPEWYFVILHKFDKTTAAVFLTIWEHTAGNFKGKRPREASISDKVFLRRANCSEEHLRNSKRRLERDGLIPEATGSARGRRYGINLDRFRALAKETVPKRTCSPRQEAPTCSPRSVPEPVMVQIPGTAGMVPIDHACSEAGGQGAQCSCPLHRISNFVDSNGVIEKLPQVNLGLDSPALGTSPPVLAATSPAENGDQAATLPQENLGMTESEFADWLEPLCQKVWQMSPVGDESTLVADTGKVIGWRREVLPQLARRIERCQGNPRKQLGLLPRLAADAVTDFTRAGMLDAKAGEQYSRTLIDGRIPESTWSSMSDAERERWKQLSPQK